MTEHSSAEAALDRLRRDARNLARDHAAGLSEALARVRALAPRPEGAALKHADFLHVIAREDGFASWPALKLAAETRGLDRAQKIQALKSAVHLGHFAAVDRLLADAPDIADGEPSLQIALYRRDAVAAALARDPGLATRTLGAAPALVHLCQSRMHSHWPDRGPDMLAIAGMLLAAGADLDAGPPAEPGSAHRLSPLYFALGHAGNLPLARWLLEQGANPDDNESLYHATELGHRDGLRLLLEFGARPEATNALPRAIDFDDAEMVRMLLEAGADPNEGCDAWTPGTGMRPGVTALHHAARRHAGPAVIDLLLAHGADPDGTWQGHSVHAFACVWGNEALRARLPEGPLTESEMLLAGAAEGHVPEGRYLDVARLPEVYRQLPREILALPGRLPHLKALIALGFPWDAPDTEGLTLVQVAGWEGLPEVMGWLLRQKPDLSHVNGYGGTLLSTIIHGSENCPARAGRDHIACARMALEEGLALPRRAPDLATDQEMAAFLAGWADAHPGQVVARGVV